jgi:hypothetical protein
MVDNRRTGTQRLAFNVLGAYGYPDPGAGSPRVWALRASHRARQQDWVELLTSLDVTTPPRLVVTDGSDEIGNAVRAVWPALPGPSFPQPYLLSCEHHLHRNGVEAMGRDGIGGPGHPMRLLLDTALRSSSGWAELCAKAVGFRATERWLAGIYTPVRQQVAVRHLLPAHHSTAALDTALGRVRDFLDARSFALRNARRTNLLLGLVRLHLNGADVERRYHALVRDFTDTARGRPGQQRTGYETRPLPGPTGDRRNAPGSLRS